MAVRERRDLGHSSGRVVRGLLCGGFVGDLVAGDSRDTVVDVVLGWIKRRSVLSEGARGQVVVRPVVHSTPAARAGHLRLPARTPKRIELAVLVMVVGEA